MDQFCPFFKKKKKQPQVYLDIIGLWSLQKFTSLVAFKWMRQSKLLDRYTTKLNKSGESHY